MEAGSFTVTVDIELTNRCNAKCHFCPRDATPHQGLMTPETFTQALARATEVAAQVESAWSAPTHVSLCGLGEPLLNKHADAFVAQVRAAGLTCGMSSNAALLDERRGRALLDAGLNQIHVNVGDTAEDYEDVYKLPWEQTRDNLVRFAEMADGQCDIYIVLVDHRRDPAHLEKMKAFWRDLGFMRFQTFGIMNRGGTLFVDHMQYADLPELATAKELLADTDGPTLCATPFGYLFIGFDGQYYLCCSDWTKQVPMGSVFDTSFLEITRQKLEYVVTREPICKTCNLDPVNHLTDELRAIAAGERPAHEVTDAVEANAAASRKVAGLLEQLVPGVTADLPESIPQDSRRFIPVTSV